MPEFYQPTATLTHAAILGLIYVVLSVQVVLARTSGKVNLGSGETPEAASSEMAATPLYVAVRCHANFAEYVPLALLLIALIELRTGPTLMVKLLGAALVLARIMHPVGMRMKAPNPFRAGGFALTLIVLVAASIQALLVTHL